MPTVRELASALFTSGAVMSVPGDPALSFLVGDFAWLDERRIFWFTAHGVSEFDGHVLEFDTAIAPHSLGIEFRRRGELVGYLTTIDESDFNDVGAAHADLLTWRTLARTRQPFIDEVKASFTADRQ